MNFRICNVKKLMRKQDSEAKKFRETKRGNFHSNLLYEALFNLPQPYL